MHTACPHPRAQCPHTCPCAPPSPPRHSSSTLPVAHAVAPVAVALSAPTRFLVLNAAELDFLLAAIVERQHQGIVHCLCFNPSVPSLPTVHDLVKSYCSSSWSGSRQKAHGWLRRSFVVEYNRWPLGHLTIFVAVLEER